MRKIFTLIIISLYFILPSFSVITDDYSHWDTSVKVNDSVYLVQPLDIYAPFCITLSVNGDPSTEIGVAWFNNPFVKNGEIHIVEKKDADWDHPIIIKGERTDKTFRYLNSDHTWHTELSGIEANEKRLYSCFKAHVSSLKPDTEYIYIIDSEGTKSKEGSFRTVKTDGEFCFSYITDLHVFDLNSFNITEKVLREAYRDSDQSSFFLINGDFVQSPESGYCAWEWEHLFARFQDIFQNIILVPVLGNHDSNSANSFSFHFNTDNSYNDNASVKSDTKGNNYSFSISNTLFFVLSFQEWSKTGYFTSLKKWMESVISQNEDKKWRIALFHICMYTGASHQYDSYQKPIRENMGEWFDENKIDIGIQGHDHIYEVIGPVHNRTNSLLEDQILEIDLVPEETGRSNMKGRKNGIFDLSKGTIYFTNNSGGFKRYSPNKESDMIAKEEIHGISDYWSLFSGRFGQDGNNSYSNIYVGQDTVNFITYTVPQSGEKSLFDSFKAVKHNQDYSVLNENVFSSDSDAEIIFYNNIIRINDPQFRKLNIYDISGKLIVNSLSSFYDLSDLNKGYYTVKIYSNNKILTKIIVR